MHGVIVVHDEFGFGRIEHLDSRVITVRFFGSGESPRTTQFGVASLKDGTLRHGVLEPGTLCRRGSELFRVRRIAELGDAPGAPRVYEVVGEDGSISSLSEMDLTPEPSMASASPGAALAALRPQSLGVFAQRESFARAYDRTIYSGFGIRALLSSRVDLRPHQAYVAATVLRDPIRRYILADEVGLGKTIEAGIILHDLLITHPAARVLIICPGSLTQQWLCELYSKFGGYVFRLLDRYSPDSLTRDMFTRAIVSYSRALEIGSKLLATTWDLVVVDEAHHLLLSETLYEIAHALSASARSVLLLSAIPAQRREDEFRRLLELLEPNQHQCDSNTFKELFDAQPTIGRRLHMLERRLEGLDAGEYTPSEVAEFAKKLQEVHLVGADTSVGATIKKMHTADAQTAADLGRKLIYRIGERYRINRRILRNRRQRLIAESQLVAIERKLQRVAYVPDQAEIEVFRAVEQVLQPLCSSASVDPVVKLAATRTLFHASIWPYVLFDLLTALLEARPKNPNSAELDFLRLSFSSSYGEWQLYAALLCSAIRQYVTPSSVRFAMRATEDWANSEKIQRYERLVSLVREKLVDPSAKILIFAGLQGLSRDVAKGLRRHLGSLNPDCVTEFNFYLKDEEKEQNVRQFQSSARVRVLVSDETGGEGRNFQFASEIIHFDIPWFAGRIEQRIGRLDRLGREQYRKDVVSTVLYPEASLEASLLTCFADGLEVFTKSISGLEFALRDTEDEIAQTALAGRNQLMELVPRLRVIAEQERARDETEAVLDAGSFDSVTAERFRRMSISAVPEQVLEREFVAYFRCLSKPRAAEDFAIPGFETRGWQFNSDNLSIRNFASNLGDPSQLSRRGTFYRKVAQGRPDLNFFNVGNPLFDTIVNSLSKDIFGRVYAVQVNLAGELSWNGFELLFYPDFENSQLTDMAFQIARKPLYLFYSADGTLVPAADDLLRIRRRLRPEDKDRAWRNYTNDRVSLLAAFVGSGDWAELVTAICERAASEAKERLSTLIKEDIDRERLRLARLIDALPRDTTPQYRSYLTSAHAALDAWRPRLDSMGFLAINPEGTGI